MRAKITIEIDRNGYTATETVEYIDRTPADVEAGMAAQLQHLQVACNLRDAREQKLREAVEAWQDEWHRQANRPDRLTYADQVQLDRLKAAIRACE